MIFRCIAALAIFFFPAAGSLASPPKKAPYQIIASVPGGGADGGWDLISVDNVGRRLYLAQEGVTLLDLDTGKVIPHFVTLETFHGMISTHDALPINGGKTLAVTDIVKNAVDFFDVQTRKLLSRVDVGPPPRDKKWRQPDVLLLEPVTGLVISVNADDSTLSLIDPRSVKKIADILIGKGDLDAAVADGKGLVYVNESDAGSIAVVDISKRKVLRTLTMKNCEEPTGMTYDAKDRLLMSVCSNGLAKFVDTRNGQELSSIKVGVGADGFVYDPQRHYAFTFGGKKGTLSIISVKGRNDIALVQTLKTKPGARLGALDPKTGRIYIPAANFGPPAKPITLPGLGTIPGLNPHTFTFIVVAPTSP